MKALADHPLVGETRGIGLIGALEMVADKASKRSFEAKKMIGAMCVKHCEKEGLILRNLPNDAIGICPPLVISEAEIDLLFDRLTTALDKTEADVSAQNLRAA